MGVLKDLKNMNFTGNEGVTLEIYHFIIIKTEIDVCVSTKIYLVRNLS